MAGALVRFLARVSFFLRQRARFPHRGSNVASVNPVSGEKTTARAYAKARLARIPSGISPTGFRLFAWGASILLACVILLLPSVAESASLPNQIQKPKLVFPDDRDIVLRIDEVPQALQVVIQAEGQLASGVTAAMGDLYATDGRRILAADVLAQTAWSRKAISAYGHWEIDLTIRQKPKFGPGTYTGILTVTARNADAIRKKISLVLPPTRGGLSFLTSKVVVIGVRQWPSFVPRRNLEVSFANAVIPVYKRAKIDRNELGRLSAYLADEYGRWGRAQLDPSPGRMSPAALTILQSTEPGRLEIPLLIIDLSLAGKYEGPLLLDPADPKTSDKVDLTVQIKDWWAWPLLFILVGVVVSYSIAKVREEWRPKRDLSGRIAAVLREVYDEQARFAAAEGNRPYTSFTIHDLVEQEIRHVEAFIQHEDLPAAQEALGKIERYVKEFASLRALTVRLWQKADEVDRKISQLEGLPYWRTDVPPLALQETREFLYGSPILESSISDKTELKRLDQQFRDQLLFLERFSTLYGWIHEAAAKAEVLFGQEDKHERDDRTQLGLLALRLKDLRKTLWNEQSVPELTHELQEGLRQVFVEISQLYLKLSPETRVAPSGFESLLARASTQPRAAQAYQAIPWIAPVFDTFKSFRLDKETPTIRFQCERIESRPSAPVTGEAVGFSADITIQPSRPEDATRAFTLVWDFGDGTKLRQVIAGTAARAHASHRYYRSKTYSVAVRLEETADRPAMGMAPTTIMVVPRPGPGILRQISAVPVTLSAVISLIIIALTGFYFLYFDKPFGLPKDYLYAFLWGSIGDQALKLLPQVPGWIRQLRQSK